jgi:hypothetical protein
MQHRAVSREEWLVARKACASTRRSDGEDHEHQDFR